MSEFGEILKWSPQWFIREFPYAVALVFLGAMLALGLIAEHSVGPTAPGPEHVNNLAAYLWAQNGDHECQGVDIWMPACEFSALPDSSEMRAAYLEWAKQILTTEHD